MNRRVLGVVLLYVFVLCARHAWAQKYRVDDPVPPDAKGLVLSMSGEVRTIPGSRVTAYRARGASGGGAFGPRREDH